MFINPLAEIRRPIINPFLVAEENTKMHQLYKKVLLVFIISILVIAALACGTVATEQPLSEPQEISTMEPELTITNLPAPTITREPTPIEQPSETLEPPQSVEPIVDVFSILGKPVDEVEVILGPTVLITPNDDNDDNLAGGEYRDYEIGNYAVFVAYDSNKIARVFQVLDGLSNENYSITDWDLILPIFGINLSSPPEREAPAAVYWDDYEGYFIAVVASSTRGEPVWTVQISEAAYQP